MLNPPAPRAYSADNRSAEITFQNRDIELQPAPERIVRQANKVGLYNALSFGDIMLQGALQKK